MAKRKTTKGQATIYKTYTSNKRSSNTNHHLKPVVISGAPEGFFHSLVSTPVFLMSLSLIACSLLVSDILFH
jgi:hypothetical protein